MILEFGSQCLSSTANSALLNLIFSQLYAGGDRLISATFNAALPVRLFFHESEVFYSRDSSADVIETLCSIYDVDSQLALLHTYRFKIRQPHEL